MDRKKLGAIALLGRKFFIHMLRKYVLRKESPGYKEFIEYYRDDRIVPMSLAERDAQPGFTRCVSCELCDPVCPPLLVSDAGEFAGPMSIASCVSRDVTESGAFPDIFLSTLCGACERVCPEGVPVVEMIKYLRRKARQTHPESMPEFYKQAEKNIIDNNTVYGLRAKPLGGDKKSILYWRGCIEAQWQSFVTTKLLNMLDIEFMTIEEMCCGGIPEELGLDFDSNPIAEHIRASGAKTVVTGCFVCASTIGKLLPEIEVKHVSRLIYEAKFDSTMPLAGRKIAFQDPCKAPHRPEEWDPPRELLRKLGAEVVELPHEKENARCCGAGGGLPEVDLDLSRRVARSRVEEILASGADILTSTCSRCARHLSGAVAENEALTVMSLDELMLEMKDLEVN